MAVKRSYHIRVLLIHSLCVLLSMGQEMTCDFEAAECPGLRISDQWQTTDGQHPANSYSPPIDQTLKTNYGHYIYIATYTSRAGKVMTSLTDHAHNTMCFEFHYFLHGPLADNIVGSVKVTLSVGGSLQSEWFEAVGNFREWRRAYIELPPGIFNVTIEAYLIRYRNDRVIAIDDIRIYSCAHKNSSQGVSTEADTKPLFQCGFEKDNLCGTVRDTTDTFSWLSMSPNEQDSLDMLPFADHTFRNSSGHYLYAVAPSYEGSAKLFVPEFTLPENRMYCLNFYYSRKFRDMSSVLYVYAIRNNELSVLWTDEKKDTVSSAWSWGVVPLPRWTRSLVFELRSYPHRIMPRMAAKRVYALDDVSVSACPLVKKLPSAIAQNTFPVSLNCDFENSSLCNGRIQNEGSGLRWVVRQLNDSSDGPLSPDESEYILLLQQTSAQNPNSKAIFHLPEVWTFRKSCIHFAVYMDSDFNDLLQLAISGGVTSFRKNVLWEKTGGSGTWERFIVELPLTKVRASFVLSKRTSRLSNVALDNIQVDNCVEIRRKTIGGYSTNTHGPRHVDNTQHGVQGSTGGYLDQRKSHDAVRVKSECTCSSDCVKTQTRSQGIYHSSSFILVILMVVDTTVQYL